MTNQDSSARGRTREGGKPFLDRFLDRLEYNANATEMTRNHYQSLDDGSLVTHPAIMLTSFVLNQDDFAQSMSWRPEVWQEHLNAYRGTLRTYPGFLELFWACFEFRWGIEAVATARRIILDPIAVAKSLAVWEGPSPEDAELIFVSGFATTSLRTPFNIPIGSEFGILLEQVRDSWMQAVLNLIQNLETRELNPSNISGQQQSRSGNQSAGSRSRRNK